MKFLVLNGVNLNLTGHREKDIYGSETLEEINEKIADYCAAGGDEAYFVQSNIEGELVNVLHDAFLNKTCDGIVFNAGAYTHYSYALRDAIAAIDIPVIEVHMSNVHAREDFRKISYVRLACDKTFSGYGFDGYRMAMEYLVRTYGK